MDIRILQVSSIIVLCNDSEIEVKDGEVCQICGRELEDYDEVAGTGIFDTTIGLVLFTMTDNHRQPRFHKK